MKYKNVLVDDLKENFEKLLNEEGG